MLNYYVKNMDNIIEAELNIWNSKIKKDKKISMIFLPNFSDSGSCSVCSPNTQFPEGITSIILDKYFNQPINNIKWPSTLKKLSFAGYDFNHSLDNINFPNKLETLILGDGFNQPLNNVNFPKSLKYLYFGDIFNQPLDNIDFTALPNLRKLVLGEQYNHSLSNVKWNDKTILEINNRYSKDIVINNLPYNLNVLHIRRLTQPLNNLPIGLKLLNIKQRKSFYKIIIPVQLLANSKFPYNTKIYVDSVILDKSYY